MIGTVAVTDPDPGDTHTFALADDAGGRFAIDVTSGEITVADGLALDFEQATSHDILVTVTDSALASADLLLTIDIDDVASPEVVTADDAGRTLFGDDGDDTLTGGTRRRHTRRWRGQRCA